MDNISASRKTLRSNSIKSHTTTISGFSSSSNQLLIDDTFQVGRVIGSGNFGEIRIGKDLKTNEFVAIKLESHKARTPQLELEYNFYRRLGTAVGIPRIFYFGPINRWNAMIMQHLGKNLEQLFNICGRKFSNITVLKIAIQLIDRFQFIHSKGIVYRDVKPENFVVGVTPNVDTDIIYIIDFGLSKEYMDINTGKHIKYRENKNLTGTARYMSVNTHMGREQSRRDDLESLGHVFIYFLKGSLPWQGLKAETFGERYKKIGTCKVETSIRRLCKNLSEEWLQYMNYVKKLEFEEIPDYSRLKDLFSVALNNLSFDKDLGFDWSPLNTSRSISSLTANDTYLRSKNANFIKNSKTPILSEEPLIAPIINEPISSVRYKKLKEDTLNQIEINNNRFYDVNNNNIVYHNKKPSLMPPVALNSHRLSKYTKFRRKIKKMCCCC